MSVSVLTLVAIAIERYNGICRPLAAQSLFSNSHAYKILGLVWVSSVGIMAPIAYTSQLVGLDGFPIRHKCIEVWDSEILKKAYGILLALLLFVIPFVVLTVTYTLISLTLCEAVRLLKQSQTGETI